VSSLAAPVASLPSRAQRTTIGRSAVPADVAQLPASVALHSLSLTVPGVMVWPAALVASGRPSTAEPAPSEPTADADADADAVSSTADTTCSPTKCVSSRAIPSQMAGITAAVAPSTSSCSGESQGGTISLNVAESLAVIALLGIRGPRLWAHVRLVTRLFAVVAEAFRRSAYLRKVADGTALVTSSSGQGHVGMDIRFKNS